MVECPNCKKSMLLTGIEIERYYNPHGYNEERIRVKMDYACIDGTARVVKSYSLGRFDRGCIDVPSEVGIFAALVAKEISAYDNTPKKS